MAMVVELRYERLHLIGIPLVVDDGVPATWEPGNQSSGPGEPENWAKWRKISDLNEESKWTAITEP